jgi:hypothetical protein
VTRRFRLLSALVLTFVPVSAWAQAQPAVGIVTTLQGQVTVSRSVNTTALPLKFKDSIFERDRINTAEKSSVRVLMGGKAIVTVRELSVLTITEDLGKTTINLESGKIAVSVARQLMKPGDRLEVHTPNAVAAVRGTVFVVEVNRQGAQLGGGNLGANTEVITVHGTVEVGSLSNPARTTLVNAYQSLGITGSNVGKLGTVTPQQMTTVLAGLTTAARRGFNQDTSAALVSKEQTKVAALETTSFVPLPSTPQVRQINNTGGCGGAPCGESLKKLPPPPPPPPRPSPGLPPGTHQVPPGSASGPNR